MSSESENSMIFDYWKSEILNAGGTKTVRVPTRSEARMIFTDQTFENGLKYHQTL